MTLSLQFFSLLLMMISGVIVGAIIEGLRFVMHSTPRRSFFYKYRIYIEIVAWIVLGLGTFYILYTVRDGIWRIYDPLAQLLGILLYEQVFQPIFRFAGRVCLRFIIRPLWILLKLLTRLVLKFVQFLLRILRFLLSPIVYIYKNTLHLALQNFLKKRYNKKSRIPKVE